jgi:hypothetical protein
MCIRVLCAWWAGLSCYLGHRGVLSTPRSIQGANVYSTILLYSTIVKLNESIYKHLVKLLQSQPSMRPDRVI